ncbi:Fic family protein [Bdellovibrio sp. HCB290]|uniref:Fic family protein n=1 Tax=Bdellovibrio sp. HCB290 TaxID=3394356 RepID=UPI0039B5092D
MAKAYIWQNSNWPKFTWKDKDLISLLSEARKLQGQLIAQVDLLGLSDQASLIADEAINTSAIEGEKLDIQSLRSSIAKRLKITATSTKNTNSKLTDGIVDVLLDATSNYQKELTLDRINNWHASLFSDTAKVNQLEIGKVRTSIEPMQVLSGSFEKPIVHFEAPPAKSLQKEIKEFLKWWNEDQKIDGLLRAGIAHLWFITLHPYDDGNGRITRALTEMALAQDEKTGRRLYSISTQILKERAAYYEILEKTQKSNIDITPWLAWFLKILIKAFTQSQAVIKKSHYLSTFWQRPETIDLNERQRKVLKKMLETEPEPFLGGMTNKKYVSITGTSRESAKRDLAELESKGILNLKGKGRSVNYNLAELFKFKA